MCAPISNASLERLFNQMNIVKSNVRNHLTNSALNALLHIKVSNFPLDSIHKNHVSRCVEYWFKKKAGEWRKENANATTIESQKFQNDSISTSQPCRHHLHLETLRVILTVKLNMFNFI